MIVIEEYSYYNLSSKEVTITIENIQRGHIDKYGFSDKYKVSVICLTEYDLKNKTEKILWSDYYPFCRGNTEIKSKGRQNMNRVNKLIIIIEGEIKNFVTNT